MTGRQTRILAYEKKYSRVTQRHTLVVSAESLGTHSDIIVFRHGSCFDELMGADIKMT